MSEQRKILGALGWIRRAHLVFGIFILTYTALGGCGVRGRPQPPLTPPEIGRGQPTFRRATEPFRFQNVPPIPADSSDEDGDEDGDELDGERRSQ